MECRHCGGRRTKKNGSIQGRQRHFCHDCGRTFSGTAPKFTDEDKRRALVMHLNNCGVRKTAMFIGCSRTTVTNWVREAKRNLDKMLEEFEPNYSESADIIELDEIYTFIEKNGEGQSFGLLILATQSVLLRL